MAIRITDRKELQDPSRPEGRAVIFTYQADTVADIAKLPPPDGRNDGSSCFVLATSQVYMLGTDGWKLI